MTFALFEGGTRRRAPPSPQTRANIKTTRVAVAPTTTWHHRSLQTFKQRRRLGSFKSHVPLNHTVDHAPIQQCLGKRFTHKKRPAPHCFPSGIHPQYKSPARKNS
jgi:hypothetical protein